MICASPAQDLSTPHALTGANKRAAQLLHGFVLLYIQSLKPGGTSAADVVYHCKCQGLTGDALTIQRVLETLVNEVQIYRNQQGNYAAL